MLGLLRACADVLVIGSGTLAASPRSVWTPEQGYPPAADAFAELRRRLGRPARLEVAVVSGSGRVDPDHPAFAAGALVADDRRRCRARSPAGSPADAIVALGERLDPADAVRGARTAAGTG